MKYIVDQTTMQIVIDYLTRGPFREVQPIIAKLQENMKEYKEEEKVSKIK